MNVLWVVIFFIVGLILGLLIAWFYWQGRIREHEAQIHSLRASLNEKEQGLRDLQTHLQEREASIERLRGRVSQSEESIRDLTAQIEARNQTISQLEGVVSERDGQIRDLKSRAEEAEAKAGGLATSLEEKEQGLQDLQTRLQDQIHEMKSRAEEAEARARELEAALRAGAPPSPIAEAPEPPTPDDLKRIEGIGPKISTLLQAAGITTFAQLAAADVSRLEQILMEANLRLADPSTWAQQARLAAAGQWDALETLQDELKGGRRV